LTHVPNTAPGPKKRLGELRRRSYAILEQGDSAGSASIALIVVTLTATVIESVPDLAITYALPLSMIEWAATLIFSMEYAARSRSDSVRNSLPYAI